MVYLCPAVVFSILVTRIASSAGQRAGSGRGRVGEEPGDLPAPGTGSGPIGAASGWLQQLLLR